MPVQQDQLNPNSTNTSFETFNSEFTIANSGQGADWVDRALHNGTDILKATLYGRNGIITPKFKYYQTNGTEKVSYTPEKTKLLDVCYDYTNNKYYTVRFVNDVAVSGLGPTPTEYFTEVSGTTGFNISRWRSFSEASTLYSGTNYPVSAFARSLISDNLVFSATSASSGIKYLRSRYYYENDFSSSLDFNVATLTGNKAARFGLGIQQESTGNVIYEVGVTANSGIDLYYNLGITDFTNLTNGSSILGLHLDPLRLIFSGTEAWTISKVGASSWQALSTTTNTIFTDSGTGVVNRINGVNFKIQDGSLANIGEEFAFTVTNRVLSRGATSGSLTVDRTGSLYSSLLGGAFDLTDLSGSTPAGTVILASHSGVNTSVSGDTMVNTGSFTYANYGVLAIERVDEQGTVISGIVNTFDAIKAPEKTFSDVISGSVMITVNPSQIMFLKVFDRIYSFNANNIYSGIVGSGTGGVTLSASGLLPSSGINSFMYNDEDGGMLNYVQFDTNTQEVRYRTLSNTQPPLAESKEVFLNIPDYQEQLTGTGTKPYEFFLHAADNTSLFYIRKNGNTQLNSTKTTGATGTFSAAGILTDTSQNFTTSSIKKGDNLIGTGGTINGQRFLVKNVISTTSLELASPSDGNSIAMTAGTYAYKIMSGGELLQFNIDPDITAFTAINSDDYSLKAGTAEIANISVDVINAWGDPLSGKTVTFQLIQGDGALNPASDVTDVNGTATTQYTAGTQAGAVRVQVTVSD